MGGDLDQAVPWRRVAVRRCQDDRLFPETRGRARGVGPGAAGGALVPAPAPKASRPLPFGDDSLSSVPATGDKVEGAEKFESREPSHG